MDTYSSAQTWVSAGYSVIPIGYRTKKPAFDALKLSGDLTGDGYISLERLKTSLPTPADLRVWFGGPRRNLGIVTGWRGLTVLDFDTTESYDAWLQWTDAGGCGRSLSTYTVRSSRGVHVYVRCAQPTDSYHVGEVDVKGRWGYVLAPPSVHPSGHVYAGEGEEIVECEHISEVFPLVRPEPTVIAGTPLSSDPWEVADAAMMCGGVGAVAAIKARVSAADLLGVSVGSKRWVMTRCPLHADTNPSMLVYRDGKCRCLAGCDGGRAMDVIGLYAALHKVSNREAIAELGSRP